MPELKSWVSKNIEMKNYRRQSGSILRLFYNVSLFSVELQVTSLKGLPTKNFFEARGMHGNCVQQPAQLFGPFGFFSFLPLLLFS
jgi:hypothetical protein